MYPGGKRFAFTIVDDTDNSTLEVIRPFYALLLDLGLRTTKTVWVYPSRDRYFGDTLQDEAYLEYVRMLQANGFEIALHNVGSGAFRRDEIAAGLAEFERKLGHPPTLFVNHGANPDNLYWGAKRFAWPLGTLFRALKDSGAYSGETPGDPHFWGDLAQKSIRYVRNHTFTDINLDRNDAWQPYRVTSKPYVNYWFSSVDARSIAELLDVLTEENIDRLEREEGVCIVYTHVAYGLVKDAKVNPVLRQRLEYLAKKNGYFVPASVVLDFLLSKRGGKNLSRGQSALLDIRWARDHALLSFKRRLKAAGLQ